MKSLAWALAALAQPALAQPAPRTLRIAMTAADVPTTSGMPNNGFEGMRFLGYPIFEALVQWDLSRADRPADIRPGLAERWEQDATDPRKWRIAPERRVDDAPWLWIVHDLSPRAMSRRVRGFVSAQSWFQDLTTVEVQ